MIAFDIILLSLLSIIFIYLLSLWCCSGDDLQPYLFDKCCCIPIKQLFKKFYKRNEKQKN